MKISEVLERVASYHPDLGSDYNGCDGIKCGDPDQECTGIVSALVPIVDVIRKTIELGCNLLYVHEPTSYLTPDYPDWRADFDCEVYNEKMKLLSDHGIVVYRDHDHMHAHRPDSIFTGVLKYMDWEDYVVDAGKSVPFGHLVEFPEAKTVEEICRELIEKVGLHGTRYIGRRCDKIKRIALVGHLYPGAFIPETEKDGFYTDYSTEIIRAMQNEKIDAIIPGEIIEWNLLSYIRDGVSLGRNMACFNIGHFNWEELGAKYAVDWLSDLVEKKVNVTYVPGGDIWNFQLGGNK
ncbi:MAG: Nif3-like dinuclear metal center hexameric protein [Butyrivibrio sp.]|nr:Nif3-like dinuclear metal center hexameric protein [Butyrivibrio sp.]MBP3824112.1 Nif3-like dinuclear metal center hexameric protein [Butyrivibrio sp.]